MRTLLFSFLLSLSPGKAFPHREPTRQPYLRSLTRGLGGATATTTNNDNTPISLEANLTEQETEQLLEAFKLFDTDNSGKIDADQLMVALRALGFEVNEEEAQKLIADRDKDNSGSLDFTEFLQMNMRSP